MRVKAPSEEAIEPKMAEHDDHKAVQTRGRGQQIIHSTIHPAKVGVIRITGTNPDPLPHYRFNRKCDRIVEAASALRLRGISRRRGADAARWRWSLPGSARAFS